MLVFNFNCAGPRWKETAVRAHVVWLVWLLQNNCFHVADSGRGAWQRWLALLPLVSKAAVAADSKHPDGLPACDLSCSSSQAFSREPGVE
ncbi:unnamed protein product [Arctogadus glacialis]